MLLTLLEKKILTEDTRSFTFAAEGPFLFEPGQFTMLSQIGAAPKDRRAFSVASAPNASTLTFLVTYKPEGHVSGFLETANIGAQIEAQKPIGRFVLNPQDTARVFIATGTGLAPMISFIESDTPKIPTTILFGVRNESRLFWTDKLPVDALITLSQPSNTWSGLKGRVTNHTADLITKNANAAWYICGNPEMVKEVRAALLTASIPTANIHFEIY